MRNNRGFNLLEVVFSIAVLGLMLVLLIGLMLTATSGSNSVHETATATSLAEMELDRWKREDFPTLTSSLGSHTSVAVMDGRDHNVQMEISRLDPTAGSIDFEVLRLVSTIKWESRTVDPSTRNRVGRVQLETMVSSSARY